MTLTRRNSYSVFQAPATKQVPKLLLGWCILLHLLLGLSERAHAGSAPPPDSTQTIFEQKYARIQHQADTLLERWFPKAVFDAHFELHCATAWYSTRSFAPCKIVEDSGLTMIEFAYRLKVSDAVSTVVVSVHSYANGDVYRADITGNSTTPFASTDFNFIAPDSVSTSAAQQLPGSTFINGNDGRALVILDYLNSAPTNVMMDEDPVMLPPELAASATWTPQFCYILYTETLPAYGCYSCAELYYYSALDGSFLTHITGNHPLID